MSWSRIDLYIGGDLGRWVLEQAEPAQIDTVITADADLAALARSRGYTVCADVLTSKNSTKALSALSVHYPKILSVQVLDRYRSAYNLHPGYLPWGRGYYPVFWALLEGTPAGATIHQMTERLDSGPIVDQIQVPYTENDTGGSLLSRVRDAEKTLFKLYWPKLCAGEPLQLRSGQGAGSYHSRAEFFETKHPKNWRHLNADAIIKLIRCLTFPGYTGLELSFGDRLVHVSMQDVT